MRPDQLATLAPYFREGERYLNGTVVRWEDLSFPTMCALYRLRELLDTRIILIRGPHPDPTGTKPYKQTAVDACAPGADLGQVAMALFRFQLISFGLYSGNSFHLDSRLFPKEPARWLAIKPAEEAQLAERGLSGLISSCADGWTYLNWSHPRASDVNQRLRTLRGLDQEATEKLSKLETWAEGHDKQDDERHDENRQRLERLNADMGEVRRHLRIPTSRPYPPERTVATEGRSRFRQGAPGPRSSAPQAPEERE